MSRKVETPMWDGLVDITRKAGAKLYCKHVREYEWSRVLPKGGCTTLRVVVEGPGYPPTKAVEFRAFARCHPKDHYNKAVGRDLAAERMLTLLVAMGMTRDGWIKAVE